MSSERYKEENKRIDETIKETKKKLKNLGWK